MSREILATQMFMGIMDRDTRILCAAVRKGVKYEGSGAEAWAKAAVQYADALLGELAAKPDGGGKAVQGFETP